jgi:hypothetical protein
MVVAVGMLRIPRPAFEIIAPLAFFLWEGLHYQPGSAVRPPKNHGPGPRAP